MDKEKILDLMNELSRTLNKAITITKILNERGVYTYASQNSIDCGFYILIPYKDFIEMFSDYNTDEHSEDYNEINVKMNDVKIFALKAKEIKER